MVDPRVHRCRINVVSMLSRYRSEAAQPRDEPGILLIRNTRLNAQHAPTSLLEYRVLTAFDSDVPVPKTWFMPTLSRSADVRLHACGSSRQHLYSMLKMNTRNEQVTRYTQSRPCRFRSRSRNS